MFDVAEQSWKEEGREGRPRLVGCVYYALGPGAAERGADYIRDYYSFFGPAVEDMARGLPSSQETIREIIRGLEEVGADELILWPTVVELDQLDRLAELVG